jgi:peptide/nickel transport system substrate-binding protein
MAFVAGEFDMTFPYSVTVPPVQDVESQMPQAMCEMSSLGLNRSLLVNCDRPPFDNRQLRQAMALAIDVAQPIGDDRDKCLVVGAVMQPPPEGLWGMPPDLLKTLPGYGSDVEQNRAEARAIMQKLGYGPDQSAR